MTDEGLQRPRAAHTGGGRPSCWIGRRSSVSSAPSTSDDLVARADVDRVSDRASHGASVGVQRVHPLDDLGIDPLGAELVVHVNAPDHQDLAVELDLTGRFADEFPSACIYPARLQRAPEGPRQSPTGGGNHVVEGRRVGGEVFGRHTIVSRYLRVHTERDGFVSAGQLCLAQRTAMPKDSHSRGVDHVSHCLLPSFRAMDSPIVWGVRSRGGRDLQRA